MAKATGKQAANVTGNFGFAESNGYTGYSVEAFDKNGNGINVWYFELAQAAKAVATELLTYDDVNDVRVCKEFDEYSVIIAA